MLASPILRIPLALASSYIAQRSSTPPNPPAEVVERQKYHAKDTSTDTLGSILWWWLPSYWITLHFISFLEIYTILQAEIPILPRPPTLLLPLATERGQLRLSMVAAAGILFASVGYNIRMSAVRHLGRQFTFELSIQSKHKLVTDGLYSLVRHPGYLGAITICCGNVVFQMGPGSVCLERGLWHAALGRVVGVFWIFLNIAVSSIMAFRTASEDAALRR